MNRAGAIGVHDPFPVSLPSISLAGKTALVTGGTDGIGKAVALGLAAKNARVIIVGRDPVKGLAAQQEIGRATGNCDIQYVPADLSLIRETSRLAEELTARLPALDYLVHSAGIVHGRRELTEEGIESNFAVNFLSRFLLTNRLLPLLETAREDARHSRIVIHGGALENGTIRFDDLNLTLRFGTLRAVSQFCRANDLFTVDLARRLAAGGAPLRTTIANLKIGVVRTNIRKDFPLWMRILVPLLADPILGQTPQEIAECSLRLLLDPQFEGVTGALYLKIRRFNIARSPRSQKDMAEARKLWEVSQRIIEQISRSTGFIAV